MKTFYKKNKKFILFLVLWLFSTNNLNAAVPQIEIDALSALYNSTNGSQWLNNNNWLTGDPCDNNWFGVSCGVNTVTELNLSHNNLVGLIATQLGDLTNLNVLNLDFNQLNGSIPSQLGSLPLSSLSLQSNKLTGPIPVEIGNLFFTIIFLNYNAISENLTQLIINNWERTQTIAPKNIRIVATSSSSLSLNWDTIGFIVGSGGYRIWMSDSINGNYIQVHETVSKTISAFTQGGLTQGQDYYFKLQSFTNPHSNNQNLVISDFSDPIVGTTDITTSSSNLQVEAFIASINSKDFKRQIVIVIGDKTGYRIKASNSGPDNTVGAGFIHNPPIGLADVSWTCSATGGAICPTSGQNTGGINLNIDLPVGSNLEFHVTATISDKIVETCCLTPGTVVNPNDIIPSSLLITSTITPPDDVDDSDYSGNVTSTNIQDINVTTGLWYNPERSGHGINLERLGDNLILVWYTYLPDGSPVWYLASGNYNESGSWTAVLKQYTWAASEKAANGSIVGTVWLNFTTDTTALFTWDLDGQVGSEPFQVLASGTPSPIIDYTGLWYPPSDSGWGLTEVTSDSSEISVLYFYDEQGQAVWGLGINQENAGSTVALEIYSGFCPNCLTVATTKLPLGDITTTFKSQTTGFLTTEINKTINLSDWSRDIKWQVEDIPIKMLSTPTSD